MAEFEFESGLVRCLCLLTLDLLGAKADHSLSLAEASSPGFGLMQYLRSKLFDIMWGLWTLLFLPTIPLLILFGSPSRGVRMLARIWLRGVFFMLRHIVRLDHVEQGQNNIPNFPCIMISNHQSPWETLAFIFCFPDVAIISKKELLRVPIFGWFVKHYPMILIDRGTGSKALRQMINDSRVALDGGRPVLIFPEGTRKSVSDRVKFKRGIEFLYSELNVAVLPVAVNSGVFWGPGRSFKRNGTITMSYLPPILPGLSTFEFRRQAEGLLQEEKERLGSRSISAFS